MKITTYRVFRHRLPNIPELSDATSIESYRLHDTRWWDEDDQEVTSHDTVQALLAAKEAESGYFRPRAQTKSYFWMSEIEFVVSIDFGAAPRSNKLSKIFNSLQNCLSNAKHEFDATHDGLTLLPNRKSFESSLVECISNIANESSASATPTIKFDTAGLTLLAFDLDHFKQINDTFGHPYGDVVLAAFAWRLEKFAEDLESTSGLKTYVGRLGGEEFQLAIAGLVDQEDGLRIADDFRQTLNTPLPSDAEWIKLAARRGIANERLPSSGERSISASIGHSLLTTADARLLMEGQSNATRVAAILIEQADVALYRAKADGRNCARSFRDIRDRHGRVLEHHVDTGIITVDIGSEVDVKKGMEFLVYHPQFFGTSAFYQSDGRTRKKLGTYPKYSSGRITIFETAREISFALVTENRQQSLFPSGSRLEYVPLGSITHLVSTQLERTQPNVANRDQLIDFTKELLKDGTRIVAINIAIHDMERLASARGTAYCNDLLAALFRAMQSAFGSAAKIGTTAPSELALVTAYPKARKNDALLQEIETIRKIADSSAQYSVGFFDSNLTNINSKKPEMAIECARIARPLKAEIKAFDEGTAAAAIQSWRSRQAWDEGIADYNRIKSFGLNFAHVENYAGLCFLERPNFDAANSMQCFKNAIELDSNTPKIAVFELNLAYALVRDKQYNLAIDHYLNKFSNEQLIANAHAPVYVESFARALYFQKKHGTLSSQAASIAPLVIQSALDRCAGLTEDWIGAFKRMLTTIKADAGGAG